MSADTQRSRSGSGCGGGGSGGGGAVRCMPTIVPPQAVSDRSIIDSVAGFINDVTLQGQTPLGDSKDHILWVRFENAADISDPCLGDDWELEGGIAPPLLLILGYVTGVQVWIVPANGEAIEVLSWRHGSVKCLRVLPTPSAGDRESSAVSPGADQFTHKRPLIALCESASLAGGSAGAAASAAAGGNGSYQYCAVNFVSLKDGETVKSIKFKSTIVDILANRSSIVVTFPERIAVFDARTLEDRLTVTTCHPSPGLNPNPVALGSRWIAYAERRLIASKRSSGGCEGDGVTSYTATVLNAAKSLGKGLRELGEQVAAGLTGSHLGASLVGGGGSSSGGGSGAVGVGSGSLGGAGGGGSADHHSGIGGLMVGGGGGNEGNQSGVVTVLDIKHPIKDISPTTGTPITCHGSDPIVAHFLAHSEAVVALAFDAPGMLLLTADRRGHDFHVFRLHPHPSGASLAAVHHLYVLHRGDTTAKVQDIAFSLDSRWVAVSTLRGTTHVFPVTPYGGPAGVRTHGSPLVVNRLSRFHRSAGLSIDGRSSSPVSHLPAGDSGSGVHHAPSATAYANPRTAPFPHPTIVQPLAQLRQPASLVVGSTGGLGGGVSGGGGGGAVGVGLGSGGVGGGGGSKSGGHGRQRNSSSSSSDDLVKPLRVCATFAKARSWLLDPPGCSVRDTPAHRIQRKPVDSLFIMAAHGALIQYDLEPKHASGTPREKICDDTPIELEVEAKAQWCLQRQENVSAGDIQPPLSLDNWLIKDRFLEESTGGVKVDYGEYHYKSSARELEKQLPSAISVEHDERWLSQVEIITHAGPHRRLWMGPQFMFKTYNTPSGSPLSSIDSEAVEICTGGGSGVGSGSTGAGGGVFNRPLQRSTPMNMPLAGGSYEQSPRMMNMNEFRHHENLDTEFSSLGPVESQLREDLADAMRESPLISCASGRDTAANCSTASGPTCVFKTGHQHHQQQQQQQQQQQHLISTASHHPLASNTGLSSVSSCSSTSIYSSTHSLSSICDHQQQQQLYHHHQQQHQFGGAPVGCKGAPGSSAEGEGPGSYFECKQPPFVGGGDGSNHASALIVNSGGSAHARGHHPEPSSRPDSAASVRNVLGGMTIAKVVNPLGTVTTISGGASSSAGPESLGSDEFMQECDEAYLHENCDEALFRPVVTVRGATNSDAGAATLDGRSARYRGSSLDRTGCGGGATGAGSGVLGMHTGASTGYEQRPVSQPASLIGRDLIVPVIEEKHLSYFVGGGAGGRQQQRHVARNDRAEPAGQRKSSSGAATVAVAIECADQPPLVRTNVGTQCAESPLSSSSSDSKQAKDARSLPANAEAPEADHPCLKKPVTSPEGCNSEEFVNIELPAVEPPVMVGGDGKTVSLAVNSVAERSSTLIAEGGSKGRSAASNELGAKLRKEKTAPVGSSSNSFNHPVERKVKKEPNSTGRADASGSNNAQGRKGLTSGGSSERKSHKRAGNIPKDHLAGNAKEKETRGHQNNVGGDEGTTSARITDPERKHLLPDVPSTPNAVAGDNTDADKLILPPLEALKIDDLELFGEDAENVYQPELVVPENSKGQLVQYRSANDTIGKSGSRVGAGLPSSGGGRGKRGNRAVEIAKDNGNMEEGKPAIGTAVFNDALVHDAELLSFAEPPLPPLELPEFPVVGETTNRKGQGADAIEELGDDGEEKTLISFESPLQEHSPTGEAESRKQTATVRFDHQGQVTEQMQGVLARGNILLAMCSSLREASPGTSVSPERRQEDISRTGEEQESHNKSSRCVAKEPSLEGQDSDYKSLELDSELHQPPVGNANAALTSTDIAATIVSLLSSASEDENDVTANATTQGNLHELEADQPACGEMSKRSSQLEPADEQENENTLGKRRRRKRSSAHRSDCSITTTSSTSPIPKTATVSSSSPAGIEEDNDNDDDDDEEDEEEEEDDDEEDDEELQPLISSNKTSSSSLSATVGNGPPTVATATTTIPVDPYSLPGGSADHLLFPVEDVWGDSLTVGSDTNTTSPPTTLPTEDDDGYEGKAVDDLLHLSMTALGCSGKATARTPATPSVASIGTCRAVPAGTAPTPNGSGNGKKKSKKKRK